MADSWEHPNVIARRKTEAKLRELERVDYNEQDVKNARQETKKVKKQVEQQKSTIINLSKDNYRLKLKQTADQKRVEQIRNIVSSVPSLQKGKPLSRPSLKQPESSLEYLKKQRQARENRPSLKQDIIL